MKRLLLLWAIFLGPVFAAGQEACPVRLESGSLSRQFPRVYLTFHNMTDKKIVGIRFHIVYTNSLGEEADDRWLESDRKVKPNHGSSGYWHYGNLWNMPSGKVTLDKVRFEDGSTWTNSPGSSCTELTIVR